MYLSFAWDTLFPRHFCVKLQRGEQEEAGERGKPNPSHQELGVGKPQLPASAVRDSADQNSAETGTGAHGRPELDTHTAHVFPLHTHSRTHARTVPGGSISDTDVV